MSTAAISKESRPQLLVVRPVPTPIEGQEDSGLTGGTVVKLPTREERSKQRSAAGASISVSANASIRTLSPEAAERAVVGAMSSKIAQAALEVLSGVRSVQQLSRWLDTMCMSALTTRARLHADACRAEARRHSHEPGGGNVRTLHHQPVVHSVHCSAVAPGIFESSVVIADKTRFRAIALRFELTKGLWKVTALQIG
ncbi:Rv3235 family protein [Arthrobacter sp. TWP1-1]|uniref:Rv3235 family protein n=1 Tax=Arthrobacter sp. TWP1-1 TaxID=2804568 RepID=UPI003CF7184E